MASIDNNIIKSLGAGSGIDSKNIVKQLTEIERSGPQGRIDASRNKAEAQISDFGLLSSAMATLSDAAKVLSDPEGMFSKSASFTESSALAPIELATDVQTGSYEFLVQDIAKSQSLTSAVFASETDAVGEGTLTFEFGSATVSSGEMVSFSPDNTSTSFSVTIDSSNNTLKGLRDAINEADTGVQATIVNNGSGFVLQINAESGALNEMQITATETGGSPTDTDDEGLSRFSFVFDATDGSQMTQNQAGQNAKLTINGLLVERETNKIDDIVKGLTLDVLKADPTPITITISDDKDFAEQGIRDFVEAYNLFLEAIEPAVGTYEEENEDGKKETLIGSLARDSLAKSVVSRIRSVISNSIPGLGDTLFTSLGTSGIQTQTDGSLSIDEEKFSEVIDDHFEDLQKMFAPRTVSSDNGVTVNSYGKNTIAGEYEVVITTQPARSQYQGQAVSVPLTTTADHTFTVNVNGKTSGSLTLENATYGSNTDIASALQKLINEDETLAAAKASVVVTYNSDQNRFDMTSNAYGTSSNVEIMAASGAAISELGLNEVPAAIAGATVVGTINGVAGFGTANVLLPALGEPGESLAMVIGDNATTATVNFSRGFAGEMEGTLSEFLANNGLFDKREDVLKKTITKADDDEKSLEVKMTVYQERLMNQFIAMEKILNGLNSSGGFLESLIDTLPFTAKK